MPSQALERLMSNLAAGAVVLIDGAVGTELELRGATMHDGAWCAQANLTHPDILEGIHRDYIRAGARLITTNTFSTNRNMLEPAGLGEQFEAMNRTAVARALAAREGEGASASVVVAGSLSHQIPFTNDPTGRVTNRVMPALDKAAKNFQEMAAMLADSGVDMLLLEMMSHPDLANLAISAARSTGLPFWVGFSVVAGDDSEVMSYTVPGMTADEMFGAIDFSGAGAAGVMHSSVHITGPGTEVLREHFDGPIMAYPDSGHFVMPHWQFKDIIEPPELTTYAEGWIEQGVQIVGGCCGLGVRHIEGLAHGLAPRLDKG